MNGFMSGNCPSSHRLSCPGNTTQCSAIASSGRLSSVSTMPVAPLFE